MTGARQQATGQLRKCMTVSGEGLVDQWRKLLIADRSDPLQCLLFLDRNMEHSRIIRFPKAHEKRLRSMRQACALGVSAAPRPSGHETLLQ